MFARLEQTKTQRAPVLLGVMCKDEFASNWRMKPWSPPFDMPTKQWFGLRTPISTCWDSFSDLIYRLKFFYQRRKGKKKKIIRRHEHKFLLVAKSWSKLFVTLMTCAILATSTGCHSAELVVYWAMAQPYIQAVIQYMSHAQPNSFTGKCLI